MTTNKAWALAFAFVCLFSNQVQAQDTVPVTVVVPESVASSQRVELTGSFTSRQRAQLSAQTAGLVQQINVEIGDSVAAGDVLIQLDTELAQLAVRRAEATVQERQASLKEAQRLLAEGQRLVKDRFVPETEVQAREAGMALAQAALTSAQADLATTNARLGQHRVRAPFDGVIANRTTEMGEWIETGTSILELIAVDDLWLDIRAPQQYWNSLTSQARAEVRVDALPGETIQARVQARVPVKDQDARTFLVRLVLEKADPRLTPGMSASAAFEWSDGQQVLRVPRDAITRYPDGSITVWVVDQSVTPAIANEVGIQTLSRNGGLSSAMLEVFSGLNQGQPVVVRGNELLSEGQAVRVVEN